MVAPAVPGRTGSGLAMRLGMFLEALARVAEVDLVLPARAYQADPFDLAASLGVRVTAFPEDAEDTHFSFLSRLSDPAARLAAFRAYGRPSLAALATAEALDQMKALGAERRYDLVHVGRVYMAEAGLAAAGAGTRLSLDLDEDDRVSLESMAEIRAAHGKPEAAEWFRIEAEATDRMVSAHGARFDRLWISSPEDRTTLAARHPRLDPALIPNAVGVPPAPVRRDDGATILFVGGLGYEPNSDGVLWYANAIWPLLRARAGRKLRNIVAGADAPKAVRDLGRRRGPFGLFGAKPDFEVVGRVPELRPLYEEATLAIAPLRGGRGTRLKLLEAAAEGVPVVATPDAARGLPLDPPWAWIADDAEAFADACLEALNDPAARARHAAQGRAIVAAEHDRAKIIARLAENFEAMLAA